MAKRSRWLDIHRKRHGIIWWVCIGWWERPIASILWLLLADLLRFKGVKYHYHR